MKRFLSLFIVLSSVLIGISCNKAQSPMAPSGQSTFQAMLKPNTSTFTPSPTPTNETSICVASGDPGTTGILITNPTALQFLGTPFFGGQWLGTDASGDCQTLGPGSNCPNLTMSSTATFVIPPGSNIISGVINMIDGCSVFVTVNGTTLSSSNQGQASFNLTNLLVQGTNTISITTNFGTTLNGGACVCNPGFGSLSMCFGFSYKICVNVIQPPASPTLTPTPSFTPTLTFTGTLSPTVTDTPTGLSTATPTFTNTFTNTPMVTNTPVNTNTPAATSTFTLVPTDTPTPVITNTPAPTPTVGPNPCDQCLQAYNSSVTKAFIAEVATVAAAAIACAPLCTATGIAFAFCYDACLHVGELAGLAVEDTIDANALETLNTCYQNNGCPLILPASFQH